MLMLLCPQCRKIVSVHDVIPHDRNIFMYLSNFVTCHLAHKIILRNHKYLDTLSKLYMLKKNRITCINVWRYWPPEREAKHSGKFLFFGRIRKYKGFSALVQIIQQCPGIPFQVVGSPDEKSRVLVGLRVLKIRHRALCFLIYAGY